MTFNGKLLEDLVGMVKHVVGCVEQSFELRNCFGTWSLRMTNTLLKKCQAFVGLHGMYLGGSGPLEGLG